MPLVDHVRRRITVSLAFHGVPRAGASTMLGWLQGALPMHDVGPLTSVATRRERTLHFEHHPAAAPQLGAYRLGVRLVAVGGAPGFGDARLRALRAADGIALVVDSQGSRLDEQVAMLRDLAAWGVEQGVDLRALPTVACWNKRDLSAALVLPVATLSAALNFRGVPEFATSALTGAGVREAYDALVAAVLRRLGAAPPAPAAEGEGELVLPTIVPPAVPTAPRGVAAVPEPRA